MSIELKHGDVLEQLQAMPSESVQCVVTSPPYWGLRDYGVPGQLGLERTPEEYVAKMVDGFREVRRVLRGDGTLWLNLGDSYAGSWGNQGRKEERGTQRPINGPMMQNLDPYPVKQSNTGRIPEGSKLKPKDLVGIPWMVAFAMRSDGWYLRQDIIWSKPNPMPESVRDRCTKAHEYLFLMSKSERYYYDQGAVKEPMAGSSLSRLAQDVDGQEGSWRVPGKTNGAMKAVGRGGRNAFRGQGADRGDPNGPSNRNGRDMKEIGTSGMRNKRSVWTIATQPYKGAHFATFPEKLVTPCVLAGSRPGDVVLDPFCGSGTVGAVCRRLDRSFIGIDLNEGYLELARKRIGVKVAKGVGACS